LTIGCFFAILAGVLEARGVGLPWGARAAGGASGLSTWGNIDTLIGSDAGAWRIGFVLAIKRARE